MLMLSHSSRHTCGLWAFALFAAKEWWISRSRCLVEVRGNRRASGRQSDPLIPHIIALTHRRTLTHPCPGPTEAGGARQDPAIAGSWRIVCPVLGNALWCLRPGSAGGKWILNHFFSSPSLSCWVRGAERGLRRDGLTWSPSTNKCSTLRLAVIPN